MAKKKPKKNKPKKQPDNLVLREPNEFYLKQNLKALVDEQSPLVNILKDVPVKPVKIDPKVILWGIKNPLVCVMIGFSTRALYEAIRRKRVTSKYMLIIEPDMGVFHHLIQTEDISDLLRNPDVDFIIGQAGEEIMSTIFSCFGRPNHGQFEPRSTMIESTEVVFDPFQFEDIPNNPQAKWWNDIINQAKHQSRLAMGCSDDQFTRHELMVANKETMKNAWNIEGLFEKFADVPCFVLGGGPSLDTWIQEYKKEDSYKQSLIIAPDAVLYKLMNNGIKPHLVVRCERKFTSIFEGVDKEMTKGIHYCMYPWTAPEFTELFDDIFYLFRKNGVCIFTGLNHGSVDGGVSSSNACLEMALKFGCKNIITAGIDLCMIGGKTHTGDTQVEFDINRSKDKWTKVQTNSGKEETTIPVWERCRREYVQSVGKHRQVGKEFNVYNTSWEGAVIPLIPYKPMNQLKDLFTKEVNVTEIIEKHRKKLPKKEIDAYDNKMRDIIPKLNAWEKQVKVTQALAKDAEKTANREIDKLVNTIKYQTAEGTSYDQLRGMRAHAKNCEKLWSMCADTYDNNFKQKCFNDLDFRLLFFDTLQLDFHHYNNECNKLTNITDFVDEKHYYYHNYSGEFLLKILYYIDKFRKLFSGSKVD